VPCAFVVKKLCAPSHSINRSACCRNSPATARRMHACRNLVFKKCLSDWPARPDSEGLLLLSDEAKWNEKLLHPRNAHGREYWAQVEKIPSPESLEKLENGVSIQGRKTLPCRAWILEPQPEVGYRAAMTGRRSAPSLPEIRPFVFANPFPIAGSVWNWLKAKNRQVSQNDGGDWAIRRCD